MKKHLLATATALAFAGALMSAATAQTAQDRRGHDYDPVNVYVDFDKLVLIYELQFKVKTALIIVSGDFYGHTAAESNAVVEQNSYGNYIDQSDPHHLAAKIDNSINKNSGIAQFNQDVGNATNQSNVLSMAVAANATFADSNASAEQWNVGGWVNTSSNQSCCTGISKDALIKNSVNGNKGIAMVNQNTGNQNNQTNVISIAASVHGRSVGANSAKSSSSGNGDPGNGGDGKAAVALSEADLGQATIGNHVHAFATVTKSTIIDSINGNSGIVTVNQTGGNFNNQGTVISLSGQARF